MFSFVLIDKKKKKFYRRKKIHVIPVTIPVLSALYIYICIYIYRHTVIMTIYTFLVGTACLRLYLHE